MELNKFMSTLARPPQPDSEAEQELPVPGADAVAELPENAGALNTFGVLFNKPVLLYLFGFG